LAVPTSANASTSSVAVFSFDNSSLWTPGGGTVSSSSDCVEGSASLAFVPSYYSTITSAPLSTLGPFTAVSLDINLPTQQPSPYWYGAVQLYVSVPSLNIYNAYLGQEELTGLPPGRWENLNFAVPSYPGTELASATYSDLTFTIALNAPVKSATYLLDDMQVVNASVVTSSQLGALQATSTVYPVPSDQLQAGIDAQNASNAYVQATLQQIATKYPALAPIIYAPAPAAPHQVQVPGAGTVTLAGKDEMDVVLADAYTSYNTLESVSHLYQLLYTVLPASCRQQIPGLPNPAQGFGTLSVSAIDALNIEMRSCWSLVELQAPQRSTATIPSTHGGAAGSKTFAHNPHGGDINLACFGNTPDPQSILANVSWPGRQYDSPVKGQDQRNTCGAMAMIGAVEQDIARRFQTRPDLSEQALFANMAWNNNSFPLYNDGLSSLGSSYEINPSWSVLDYPFIFEDAWVFNSSPYRQPLTQPLSSGDSICNLDGGAPDGATEGGSTDGITCATGKRYPANCSGGHCQETYGFVYSCNTDAGYPGLDAAPPGGDYAYVPPDANWTATTCSDTAPQGEETFLTSISGISVNEVFPSGPSAYTLASQNQIRCRGCGSDTAGTDISAWDIVAALQSNESVYMWVNLTATINNAPTMGPQAGIWYPSNDEPLVGGHCIEVSGYVLNQDLPLGIPPDTVDTFGGGYLILKNSWNACSGNAGYYYLPFSTFHTVPKVIQAATSITTSMAAESVRAEITNVTDGKQLGVGNSITITGAGYSSYPNGPIPCSYLSWKSTVSGDAINGQTGCSIQTSFPTTGIRKVTLIATGTAIGGAKLTNESTVVIDVVQSPEVLPNITSFSGTPSFTPAQEPANPGLPDLSLVATVSDPNNLSICPSDVYDGTSPCIGYQWLATTSEMVERNSDGGVIIGSDGGAIVTPLVISNASQLSITWNAENLYPNLNPAEGVDIRLNVSGPFGVVTEHQVWPGCGNAIGADFGPCTCMGVPNGTACDGAWGTCQQFACVVSPCPGVAGAPCECIGASNGTACDNNTGTCDGGVCQ